MENKKMKMSEENKKTKETKITDALIIALVVEVVLTLVSLWLASYGEAFFVFVMVGFAAIWFTAFFFLQRIAKKNKSKIEIYLLGMLYACMITFGFMQTLPVLTSVGHIQFFIAFVSLLRVLKDCRNNKNKKEEQMQDNVLTKLKEDICANCGKKRSQVQFGMLSVLNGKLYCDSCKSMILESQRQLQVRCDICATEIAKEEIRVVAGKKYCPDCFLKQFSHPYDNDLPLSKEEPKQDVAPEAVTPFEMLRSLFEIHSTDNNVFGLSGGEYAYISFVPLSLPLCYMDLCCIFTAAEKASAALDRHITDPELRRSLKVETVKKADAPGFFAQCLCAGYKNAVIDNREKMSIASLADEEVKKDGFVSCPDFCNGMIFQQETHFVVRLEAKHSNGIVNFAKEEQLISMRKQIVQQFASLRVLIPKPEAGENACFFTAAPANRYLVVFTDPLAAECYLEEVAAVPMEKTFAVSRYGIFKADTGVQGIIVNPGREHFLIHKNELQLSQEDLNVNSAGCKSVPAVVTFCCGSVVEKSASFCTGCGKGLEMKNLLVQTEMQIDPDETAWNCACGMSNPYSRKHCAGCGKEGWGRK